MATKRSTSKSINTKSETVSSTVINITDSGWGWSANDLAQANRAVISSRSAGVMITWHGVDPTAELGHPVMANEWASVEHNANILLIRLLREAGDDAEVTITLEV